MNQKNKRISTIDLFCGIGGLTKGLNRAGINVKLGVDQDKSCKYAYEANNKAKFLGNDISVIKSSDLSEYWTDDDIKILVGCAPCQPFSSHSNKVKNKESTVKWNLLNEFLRIVKETEPSVVSMENVPNLSNKTIFTDFVRNLECLGYKVSYSNVFCPDYGIPQKRRRLVLLASKFGEIKITSKTHKPKNYVSVQDAIGDLEFLKNGQKSADDILHFTSTLSDLNLQRIKSSKPNGTWEDWDEDLRLECHKKESGKTYKAVYGRMSWHEPSPTITTQFYNYGTGRFGHPEQHRALSIREASILQTFPKTYKFIDKKSEPSIKRLGTHIGNAVPVRLGFIIGKSIKNHLKKYDVI